MTNDVLIYTAQFVQQHQWEENRVFVLELLKESPSHPELKKGSSQILCVDEDEFLHGNFFTYFSAHTYTSSDPLNLAYTRHFNYEKLVGLSFDLKFHWIADESALGGGNWRFISASIIENPLLSLNKTNAVKGNIIDIAVTESSIEILFKSIENNLPWVNRTTSYQSFIFDFSKPLEEERFTKIFGEFVSGNNKFEYSFTTEELIVIEKKAVPTSFYNLTSLNTYSDNLIAVIAAQNKEDNNDVEK